MTVRVTGNACSAVHRTSMWRSVQRFRPISNPSFSIHYSGRHLSPRFLSAFPEPTQNSSAANRPVPQPTLHRKVRIDLSPSPVKPKNSTLSSSHVPAKPTAPSPRPPLTPSLGSAKEVSKRDIEEAEAHGILTPPPADANWFRTTLHKVIQLAKFYYRGVKLIFVRRKEVLEIKARIKAGGTSLTRSEHRLIAVQKDDIRKVIPFIVIALLLEEIIPLIAIYLPSLLPSTCILPSQRARIEEKKEEKATAFSSIYKPLFSRLRKLENPVGHLPLEVIRQSGASEAICGILRISTVGPDIMRIRRIRQRLFFIAEDDQFLLRGHSPLSERELNEALEERGIFVQGLTLKSKQSLLEWWLQSVRDVHVDALLSRRLALLLLRY
ncbi:hypothetical protein AX15_003178 [Amanita polypyramis BW_CC]|nr:hypothetical protein AX15_003178 [Amanita polypyramis BW_CC]